MSGLREIALICSITWFFLSSFLLLAISLRADLRSSSVVSVSDKLRYRWISLFVLTVIHSSLLLGSEKGHVFFFGSFAHYVFDYFPGIFVLGRGRSKSPQNMRILSKSFKLN